MTTSTPLELAVDAAVGALSAYAYPFDTEVRMAAMQAAHLVGVDYLDTVAFVMESTNGSADSARWTVAESFIVAVAAFVKNGEQPRTGVLASGLPSNGVGLPDTEGDEYT